MRARRLVGTAAAVVAALAALGTGPAGAQAGPGLPPGGHALPHLDPTALAVDDDQGVVAVLSPAGVALRHRDGSRYAELDVDGTEIAAAGGFAYVLDPAAPAIHRIDLGVLTTTTWPLAGRTDLAGLAVGGGRVWTTGRATGTGTNVLGVDLTTGAVTAESPTIGATPFVLAATDGRLVAVEQSPQTVTDVFEWAISGGAFTSLGEPKGLPQSGVVDAAISYDNVGLLVRSTSHPSELREYWLGRNLLDLRTTYPSGAGTVAFAANRHQQVLAWSRAGVDGPETVVRSMYGSESLSLDLAFPATYGDLGDPRDLALAPDGQWVYAAIDGTGPGAFLVAHKLSAEADSLSHHVVGTVGGATVTLNGTGLDDGEVVVDHLSTTTVAEGDTQIRFTMPARPAGTSQVVARNRFDIGSTPLPLVVADLGVHDDLAAMIAATVQLAGVPRPEPTTVEVYELNISEGASAGSWPVALVAQPAFAQHRAPLTRLYRAMLERTPDKAGLAFWLDRLGKGGSLSHTASAFAASPEFRQRYGPLSNSAFVDRLYENVLDRPADSAGKAHWVQQLERGATRGKVALWFSESKEHKTRTAAHVQVVLLHLALLQRPPTGPELADGVGTDPEVLALELLGSAEHGALVD